MKRIFALLFFFLTIVFSYAQESHFADYKVFRNQEEVGTLTVSKESTPGSVLYSLYSSVKIKTLITIHVRETIVNEIEHDTLINSFHKREINDINSINNILEKSGDHYVSDAKTLHYLGNHIKTTALSLYFQEPVMHDNLYSESFMEVLSIEKMKPGVYRLLLPNQNITDYHYENGALTRVEAHTKWGLVTFQRILPLAANKP